MPESTFNIRTDKQNGNLVVHKKVLALSCPPLFGAPAWGAAVLAAPADGKKIVI